MEQDVSLVTASPYHPDGQVCGVPAWRLQLSRLASWCYRVMTKTDLRTYTSCFRLYRKSHVVDLDIREPGFVGVAELLWQVARRGRRVVEAPAKLTSRRVGYSKMRTLPVILAHMKLMCRIARDRIYFS
jgi:dolichol-phosphate mannosyltransferase